LLQGNKEFTKLFTVTHLFGQKSLWS